MGSLEVALIVAVTDPAGEAAAMLWDGVLRVAATPGFHELRGAPAR